MDIYKRMIYQIKDDLNSKGKHDAAKNVKKILDRQIFYLTEGIFKNLTYKGFKDAVFYIRMYSLVYITKQVAKYGLISYINPNYIFSIHLKWEKMTKNGFRFKSMKKLNYEFKRRALDTEYVYEIINNYEKNII